MRALQFLLVIEEEVMRTTHRLRLIGLAIAMALAPAFAAAEFTTDSLKTVRKNVAREKAVLVDVRSQEEWDRGHIEGSIFLPVTALVDEEADLDALTKDLPEDKILYTFCVVGIRADAAGEVLEELGYAVRVLKPGYKQLVKAGFKPAKREK
jgi:phage shock protein E